MSNILHGWIEINAILCVGAVLEPDTLQQLPSVPGFHERVAAVAPPEDVKISSLCGLSAITLLSDESPGWDSHAILHTEFCCCKY